MSLGGEFTSLGGELSSTCRFCVAANIWKLPRRATPTEVEEVPAPAPVRPDAPSAACRGGGLKS
eukprot:3516015-Pyramimonas_sp.AAC.1